MVLLLGQRDHVIHIEQSLPPFLQVRWLWDQPESFELAMVAERWLIPGRGNVSTALPHASTTRHYSAWKRPRNS